MTEWWTYRLSDLILFSDQTYYRLFELYNKDIWPLQLLALLAGPAILILLWKKPAWHGRSIAAILALCWLWIGWAYHQQRFAEIHWVATWYATAFYLQAVLLIWIGLIQNRLRLNPEISIKRFIGTGLFAYSLFIHPFIGPISGRAWSQLELFGITPDPTVLATLGILLLTSQRNTNNINWPLFLIPVCWCLISGATLRVLEAQQALLMPLAVILVLFSVLRHAGGKQSKQQPYKGS